jgi:polyisoprenoid-binding protein YceI
LEKENAVHLARPLMEDTAVRYVIDTQGSTFTVQAFSKGLLSAFGHDPKIAIRDFKGDVEFIPGAPTFDDAKLSVTIQSASLDDIDDISEADRADIHRRVQEEVLETDRYPEITYECSRVTGSGSGDRFWLALNGELTLHGVTRSLPVSVRVVVNGSSLRASGAFSILQSDFGIAPVSAVGGAIRVKDELKCNFDIVARKQE